MRRQGLCKQVMGELCGERPREESGRAHHQLRSMIREALSTISEASRTGSGDREPVAVLSYAAGGAASRARLVRDHRAGTVQPGRKGWRHEIRTRLVGTRSSPHLRDHPRWHVRSQRDENREEPVSISSVEPRRRDRGSGQEAQLPEYVLRIRSSGVLLRRRWRHEVRALGRLPDGSLPIRWSAGGSVAPPIHLSFYLYSTFSRPQLVAFVGVGKAPNFWTRLFPTSAT